jgi:mono/diheme cytochrome c family protein
MWLLFVALLLPAGLAGWAVGHYTSLGKAPSTVVHTVTVGSTAGATTTSAATTSAATTSGGTTTSSSATGNAAAGKAVFASSGCASCHTFKPAGATGTIGPNLDTAPAADAKRDNNMNLEAFIRQSIVSPDAYIAQGYNKGLMPTYFGKQLKPSQLNDLVAFILAGTSKG